VWKDALNAKAQAPYLRHTLSGGTLRDFHFCPFEASNPFSLLQPPSLPCPLSSSSSFLMFIHKADCTKMPSFLSTVRWLAANESK
jgi:hypothetical protein